MRRLPLNSALSLFLFTLVLVVGVPGIAAADSTRAAPRALLASQADGARPSVQLDPILDGLHEPVGIAHAGDGSRRLFVLEREGRVVIVRDGQVFPTPFL